MLNRVAPTHAPTGTQEAYSKGPREKLLYIPAVVPPGDGTDRPDYLVTVDVDPESSEFGKIIHRLPFPYVGDELHHRGEHSLSLADWLWEAYMAPGK